MVHACHRLGVSPLCFLVFLVSASSGLRFLDSSCALFWTNSGFDNAFRDHSFSCLFIKLWLFLQSCERIHLQLCSDVTISPFILHLSLMFLKCFPIKKIYSTKTRSQTGPLLLAHHSQRKGKFNKNCVFVKAISLRQN